MLAYFCSEAVLRELYSHEAKVNLCCLINVKLYANCMAIYAFVEYTYILVAINVRPFTLSDV